MIDEERRKIRALIEELRQLAGEDDEMGESRPNESHLHRRGDLQLWAAARREIARRAAREKLMADECMGEAAWNILLDLFDMEMKQRRVSVTSACIASRVPSTTALRHITDLVKSGVIWRVPDPEDKRKTYLMLSPKGKETLVATLRAGLDAANRAERKTPCHSSQGKVVSVFFGGPETLRIEH